MSPYLTLTHWFWPNPGLWQYSNPKVLALIFLALLLMIGSFVLRAWRVRVTNSMTRKLSASWASASFWFGLLALFLIICRTEQIQFLAMRILWVVWFLCLVLYIGVQFFVFKKRHYTIVARDIIADEREKYLPRRAR